MIVGASLTGLASAIALARLGLDVTVLEQAVGAARGGAGLGVDRALLAELVGVDPRSNSIVPELSVVKTSRDASTWQEIHKWLRQVAERSPTLAIREGVRVTDVAQDSHSAVARAGVESFKADVVVGADGYRSVVRATIDPQNPQPRYAGFVLWRALVPESAIEAGGYAKATRSGRSTPVREAPRLIAYYVPGIDGATDVGRRQVSIAWYDATRDDWMREHGFIAEGTVLRSIEGAEIDSVLRADLRSIAERAWSSPVREIVLTALDTNLLFGTPLADYRPRRMSLGRVAILGDAAHVASPMMGQGLWAGATALRCAMPSSNRVRSTPPRSSCMSLNGFRTLSVT